MAGLTSQGVGSGLDIAGLVAKLVAAEKAPRQTQITRAQTSTVTTISALASLKGAMGAFKDSLATLKTVEVFAGRSASSSKPETFTAMASTSAVAGQYDVEVEHLATAHQISSNAFVEGAAQVVGNGTLTISVGEKTFSVSIAEGQDTLAQIRDAINQATDNDDTVRATLVNAADGAHLVLSASDAGDDNQIVVAASGGDGGLAVLDYDAALTTNYRELREAHDAVVYVAGYEHRSTTNTFENVVDGLTITALKADDDEVHTVSVANDNASTIARVRKFVEEYNALGQQIASLRSYDPTTKVAGPLLGDAMLRGIESDLRTRLSNPVGGLSGDYQTLASIGITTQKNGSLSLDNAKLTKALEADFDGVAKLFGSADGVAARLSATLEGSLAADAQISTRTKTLNERSVALQKQQGVLELRMQEITRRYNAQFNALDSLLANLSSQSAFLSQQLSNIAKIGGGK